MAIQDVVLKSPGTSVQDVDIGVAGQQFANISETVGFSEAVTALRRRFVTAAETVTLSESLGVSLSSEALNFNAAADFLQMPAAAIPSNGPWTVTCWIKITADANAITSFWTLAGAFASTWHGLHTEGDGTTLVLSDTGTAAITLGTLTLDKWYFVAIWRDASTNVKSYLGEETSAPLATATGTVTGFAYDTAYCYVASDAYDRFIRGSVALVGVWPRVLSDVEIESQRYSRVAVPSTPNAFWPINNASTPGTDTSGNGRALTNTGGSWTAVTGPVFPSGGTAYTASVSETVTSSESVLSGVQLHWPLSETVAWAESVNAGRPFQGFVSESLTLSEAVSQAKGSHLSLSETLQFLEKVNDPHPVDFSTSMPHISLGKPVYGSGTTYAKMFDNAYGYTTVDPGAWACADGDWVAINLGSGPSQILVCLSDDNAGAGSYIVNTFPAYRLQVSNDSTNGSDGTWTTAVTVTGNGVFGREHLISFTGYSWLKLIVDDTVNGQLDELDVWDASNGTPDTFAFVGDSITLGSVLRHTYFGGGNRPSFQDVVLTNKPGHYPLQMNLGIISTGVSDWISNISTALALYPDIKYWCISLGTNDAAGMPGSLTTWRSNMTTIINAIVTAGKIPILARAPYTGAAGYGGGNVETCGLRYLNDYGVDYICATLGVRRGPDLYQLFYDNRVAFVVETDPHPNEEGRLAWNQAWADSVSKSITSGGSSYLASLSETVASSETLSSLFHAVMALTETVSLGESQAAAHGMAASVSETVPISELISFIKKAVASVSETVVVSESATSLLRVVQSVTETVTISDSLVGRKVLQQSLSESVLIGESIVARLSALVSTSDSVVVTDSLFALAHLVTSLSDSIATTETLSSNLSLHLSLAESISVSENFSALKRVSQQLTETLTLGDSLASVARKIAALAETLTVTDAALATKRAAVALSETDSISDSLASRSALHSNVSETVSASDSLVSKAAFHGTLSDTVNVTEGLAGGGAISLSDAVALSEALTALSRKVAAVSETVTASESLVGVRRVLLSLPETINLSDSTSSTARYHSNLSELDVLSEALAARRSTTQALNELFPSSEILGLTATFKNTLSEVVGTSESVAAGLVFHAAVAETVSLSESLASALRRVVGISESIGFSEAIATKAAFKNTLTEPITLSDSVLVSLHILKSLSETVSLDEVVVSRADLRAIVSDSIFVSENLFAAVHALRGLSETVTISDTITASMQFVGAVNELVVLNEAITQVRRAHPVLTETVSLSDADTSKRTTIVPLSEVLAVSDALTSVAKLISHLTDSISVSEIISVSGNTNYAQPISETVSLTEQTSSKAVLHNQLSDIVAASELVSAVQRTVQSLSETVVLGESVIALKRTSQALIEALGVSDSLASKLRLQAQPSESVDIAEVLEAVARLKQSLDETQIVTESINNSAVLTVFGAGQVIGNVSIFARLTKALSATAGGRSPPAVQVFQEKKEKQPEKPLRPLKGRDPIY